MSGGTATRCGLIGWFAALLMAMPATAQTLPATSGSLWFYSPGHYPPFHQFRTRDCNKQAALIPHHHSRRRDNAGLHEQPC